MSENKDEARGAAEAGVAGDEANKGDAAGRGVGDAASEATGDDRRSFIRRLVSGSLVAGGVAATVLPARQVAAAPVIGKNLLAAPSAKPLVKLTFNRRRPPTLDDLVEVVAVATGKLGCTGCGFDGIDLRLVIDELVDPDPPHWVAEIEEQVGF